MSTKTVNFINSVKDGAIQGQANYGILASLTIAQAILESGWGGSGLSQPPYNNLFGIKSGGSWTGAAANFSTKEWNETTQSYDTIVASFRCYASWNDSIKDHGLLLSSYSRYADLIGVTDYNAACDLIQGDGYATSPTYAQSLKTLIDEYNLDIYDSGSYSGGTTIDLNSLNTRALQAFLNACKIYDNQGLPLIVDGKNGNRTQQATAKAKIILKSLIS